MHTSSVRLIDYFNGTKQYVIPLFQRRYSWTKKNWDRLWDDLLEMVDAGPTNHHYMGAIVSAPTQTVPVGVNKSLVIDGQQRLTTIALLLCALRRSLDELNAARITDLLTNRTYEDLDEPKILPTQGDRDVFFQLIRDKPVSDSSHLMFRAFKYFAKRLDVVEEETEGKVKPADVMEALRSNIWVVQINLGTDDDPHVIFESLNYLGEPLTHADLVRNSVLMKFPNTLDGGDQERVYRDYWIPMEQRLGDKLTPFLMHYGRKDGNDVRKTTIYKSFKERFDNLATIVEQEKELALLSAYSEYYEKFLCPDKESCTPISVRLKAFESLDMSSHYPVLLRVFAALDDGLASEDEVIRCLDFLESYIVRRSVVGLPNNAIDLLFIQVAGTIDPSDVAISVSSRLKAASGRTRWPSDSEFTQAIITQQQYGKKSTKYILRRLEQNEGHKEMADLTSSEIEHVMPQVLSRDWQAELGPDADAIRDRRQHTLGNLTLTGYNPELSNQSFEKKRKIYLESHIELNKWISARVKWDEKTILERGEMLAAECVTMWPQ